MGLFIMFTLIVSWRQNLFLGLLVLVIISNVGSQEHQLCASWWIEQQRLGGVSLQVVGRAIVIPAWYARIQEFLPTIRAKGNRLVLWLIFHFIAVGGMVWLWILRWCILQMMIRGVKVLQFGWGCKTSLPRSPGVVKMGMMVSVLPDLRKEAIVELAIPAGIEVVSEGIAKMVTLLAGVTMDPEGSDEASIRTVSVNHGQRGGLLPGGHLDLTRWAGDEELESGWRATVRAYDASIERQMQKFYRSLSEKDKRRYAGIEAMKLGHGGRIYISRVFRCDRKTVIKGINELKELAENTGYEKRIRKPGAGRKRYHIIHHNIDHHFLDILKNHTAGDPMREEVLWTNLTHREIVKLLAREHGLWVSTTVVRQLLESHNYRRRKAQKKETMKQVPNRNEQFENITKLTAEYNAAGNPVISIDTKKKENIGNFYRDGHLYTQQELHTYDHDFSSFAKGVIIPHGIYDQKHNTGYINLGTSKDTGQFACDSLRIWWYNYGRYAYPQASSILILCDGGGSNSSRHYLFKEDLQKLVNEIGIEIRIAHYPPYASKYNPIEHRLFPHVTRACQGVIFENVQLVKKLMEKTKTTKGLKVTVQVIDKVYETGRKVADEFKENMQIVFDDYLPQWNYRAVPNGEVI
jgi:transposase